MNCRARVTVLAVLAAAFGVGTTVQAQVISRGNFDVGIGGGAMLHPNHSALVSTSPLVSFYGRILVTDNIGLGFSLDYTRTETDDDIFPLGQFQFPQADSTLYVALKQPLTLFHYQFTGSLGLPVGERLYPYLTLGIGGYSIYLDPQQNERPDRESDLLVSFGGRIKIGISGSSALELSVRDVVYLGYDREALDPTLDRTCREGTEMRFAGRVCPNERFPLLNPQFSDPDWSPGEGSVHNIVFGAAFSFIPRL